MSCRAVFRPDAVLAEQAPRRPPAPARSARAGHPGELARGGHAPPRAADRLDLRRLLQHLALNVERFWFRQVMTGEQVEPDEFGDDGWQVRPEVSAAAVLDLYQRETGLADKIISATSLEAPPAWWPDFFPPSFHLDNLRQVLLHVIAETATQAATWT